LVAPESSPAGLAVTVVACSRRRRHHTEPVHTRHVLARIQRHRTELARVPDWTEARIAVDPIHTRRIISALIASAVVHLGLAVLACEATSAAAALV